MNFLEKYLDMVLSYHDGAKKAVYHFSKKKNASNFRSRAKENKHVKTAKQSFNKVTITYEKSNLHPDTTTHTNR